MNFWRMDEVVESPKVSPSGQPSQARGWDLAEAFGTISIGSNADAWGSSFISWAENISNASPTTQNQHIYSLGNPNPIQTVRRSQPTNSRPSNQADISSISGTDVHVLMDGNPLGIVQGLSLSESTGSGGPNRRQMSLICNLTHGGPTFRIGEIHEFYVFATNASGQRTDILTGRFILRNTSRSFSIDDVVSEVSLQWEGVA